MRHHRIITALLLSIYSTLSFADAYSDAAARSQQMANQSYMNGYMMGQAAKGDSKTAKMMRFMAMQQMMQAQAAQIAAMRNEENSKKGDDKKETKAAAEVMKMELADLKIPEQGKNDDKLDTAGLTPTPDPDPALPPPAIPEVKTVDQILATLEVKGADVPKMAAASPSPTPAAAVPTKQELAGPSKVPEVMPDPANDPKGENKLAYDNTPGNVLAAMVPRAIANTTAPLPGIDPAAAQPPPAGDTEKFARNTTEPEEVEGGSGGGGTSSSSSGGVGSEGDALSFLNSLMGPPARGPAAADEEIWMPEPQENKENAGTNLFQYASYRYRVLHKKKTIVASVSKTKKK